MSRFQWPDVPTEPGQQGQIFGYTAKYGLAKMDMSLNKTRHHKAFLRIDNGFSPGVKYPYFFNSSISNQNRSALNHIAVSGWPDAGISNQLIRRKFAG